MGIFHNHDPIFFYHKNSKSSTDNAFGGVVTPSGRRLSKDYERLPATSETFIYIAMIRIMVRRLA
jgi:hypothetical protein